MIQQGDTVFYTTNGYKVFRTVKEIQGDIVVLTDDSECVLDYQSLSNLSKVYANPPSVCSMTPFNKFTTPDRIVWDNV